MIPPFIQRIPWPKFLLLWFLALLMGASLLWLHYGFTPKILMPVAWLALGAGAGLVWGTTRPRWQKAHCAWCGARVAAKAVRRDGEKKAWVTVYECARCGQVTEKTASGGKAGLEK